MSSEFRFAVGLALATCLVAEGTAAQTEEVKPAQDQILGARASIEPDRTELLWLESGAEIRQSPEWDSPVAAVVDIRIQVPIAHQQDDWLLVRYAGWKGWVHRTGEREQLKPEPFSTVPNKTTVAEVMELIGPSDSPFETLGPFTLISDVTDRRLLAFLDKVAGNLTLAYRTRYGLDPGEETLETVALLADEADYRAFTRKTTESPGVASGHATRGLAIVAVGDKPRDEVAAILVHELTHLLNRRIFRRLELPWLDEGMGNDLAYCRVKRRSGKLDLGSLGGRSVVINIPVYLVGGESRVDREVRLEGPAAALSLLRENPDPLPLDSLLALEPHEFMDPIGLRTRYDQSTFFIRFLLDSGDPRLARGLKDYLRLLSDTDEGDPVVDLATYLAIDTEELERRFSGWLDSGRAR